MDHQQAVLQIVRDLVAETSPWVDARQVTLDSALDQELALDSMARMELLTRLERRFGLALPQDALFAAATPRDLATALVQGSIPHAPATPILPPPGAAGLPRQASTLVEVLEWHVHAHPDRPHLYLPDEPPLTYGALWQQALSTAGALRERGVRPGDRVALMLPTSTAYFTTFAGVLLAGGVPVPLYPPFRPAGLADHLRRQTGILSNAGATLLVSIPEVASYGRLLHAQVEPAAALTGPPAEPYRGQAEDLALLQYTSGSTGHPKGVMLSHANLLANVRALGQAADVGPEDVFVSWLPLYHDMGLIGAWLGSLYHALPLAVMPPQTFLARPERWLWTIHRYRGTISAAPNFAYEICARKLDEAALAGLDLSSWRLAVNGAEPVSAGTLERFARRFAPYGFKREALAPVYGLAECAVGLAFPPPGRGPRVDRVDRGAFEQERRARPADGKDALTFVACGRPLPGHAIRIVDKAGREVPERMVGQLEFTGPSCTSGYFRDPETTRALFDGTWLRSGDLAYMAGSDVYLTGRAKDLVIVAGRNLYAPELEEAVGDVPGVRRGCVAVFGSPDPMTGTERLVVAAEVRRPGDALRRHITAAVQALWDVAPDVVLLLPPHAVPKTSSGKVRRSEARVRFERGELARPRPPWRQALELAAAALPGLRREAAERLYAGYAWTCFGLLAVVVWPAVALLPRRAWRAGLARASGRLLLRLLGVPLHVEGRPPAAGPCVYTCNHASYLDALVLVAALPPGVRYVAKRSFERHFFSRVFMERLGVLFVERDDPRQGTADVRPLATALQAGDPLLIFPEGGIDRAPGLRPFHMGAFALAAEAGVPVVPLAIWGTRALLRSESWFPRRGPVRLSIGEPISPVGDGWESAVRLRDITFARILDHAGEPASHP